MQIARLLKTEKSILSINRLNTFSPDIDAENMDMFLSLCKPKTSSWFKNLSVGFASKLNPKEIIKYAMEWKSKTLSKIESYRPTMKTCIGVTGLFRNTILLKAPQDITINIIEGNQVVSEMIKPSIFKIDSHEMMQYVPGNPGPEQNRWSKYVHLKISYPFVAKSTHPVIFAQPFWHIESPLIVAPGGLFGTMEKHFELNLNAFIISDGSEHQIVNIKQGDILAYLVFPYPVSLKYDTKIKSDVTLTHMFNKASH